MCVGRCYVQLHVMLCHGLKYVESGDEGLTKKWD